jgi:RNA polymerase sigma-70 factor (ECF subfamily)
MDRGAELYRRYLDGDESAFDGIMDELFFGLVFFINRYVRDVHAAEDIAMDATSELFVHPDRYNFKTTLKTYLYMIGKHLAFRYLKKRRRRQETDLPDPAGIEGGDDPAAEVLSNERSRILSDAIGKLPRDLSVAIHLIYFEGMSYVEAAAVMGKNKKQIDNLLYRAKKALRELLGEEGKELL